LLNRPNTADRVCCYCRPDWLKGIEGRMTVFLLPDDAKRPGTQQLQGPA
jgi:hypothetical protein